MPSTRRSTCWATRVSFRRGRLLTQLRYTDTSFIFPVKNTHWVHTHQNTATHEMSTLLKPPQDYSYSSTDTAGAIIGFEHPYLQTLLSANLLSRTLTPTLKASSTEHIW